jgi:predicted NUDIX family phosphoesterase
MAPEEQVLVIDQKVLNDAGMFQGLALDVDRYLPRLFAPGVPRFIPRSKAESEPSYKQLIPYVIISHSGRFLSYVRGRRAGESRLVGLRSIGIGGHINPADDEVPLFDTNFREMYDTAVRREVDEELSVNAPHSDSVVALLNDDSNDVGSVHLGIVHHWLLDSPDVTKREQMITQLAFLTPEELRAQRDSMETWSQICLDLLPLSS